jgi:hypothetical protein
MLLKSVVAESGAAYALAQLSFSSATAPGALLKALRQRCNVKKFLQDGINKVGAVFPRTRSFFVFRVFSPEIALSSPFAHISSKLRFFHL